MNVIAPINLIEVTTNRAGKRRTIIADTRLRVQDIVRLYVRGESSIPWIVENFDLTPAQIHAALAYYYEHEAEIEAEMAETDIAIQTQARPLKER